MKNRTITALAAFATLSLILTVLWSPAEAAAADGWDWWDAVEAQQNHNSACPANPPNKAAWEGLLDGHDDPHWTELTVYFIAYPCSSGPARFLMFRDWLNYEVHGVGTWDSDWAYEKFYEFKGLVYELDESPAGYWDGGGWD